MALDYRILIGFPNRIDQAVSITGGDWAANLPLAHLQDRRFARVARSSDADPPSTQFVIDYGQPRTMQIIALVAHTLSLTSDVRFQAFTGTDMESLVYDSGFVSVWAGLATGVWDISAVEWEDDNFWMGTYTPEEIEGLTAVSTHLIDPAISAQVWKISIRDPGNGQGYVQIGRLFMGDGWQPRINIKPGMALGYEIQTAVERSLGGAAYFDEREPYRIFDFTLQYMQDREAYGQALELIRRAGVSREVFVIPDPTDAYNGLRRNFMGRIRQPSALEHIGWANGGDAHDMVFQIEELR